jgi:hypothetical protein
MKISKAETPTERQLSKNMILGLGFSMAWATFATNLLAGMLGSKPVQFTMKEVQRFGIDVAAFEARRYGWEEGVTCGDQVRQMIANGARLPTTRCCSLRGRGSLHPALPRDVQADRELLALVRPGARGHMARELAEGESPDAVRMEFGCLKVIHRGLVKPNGMILRYPVYGRRGAATSTKAGLRPRVGEHLRRASCSRTSFSLWPATSSPSRC